MRKSAADRFTAADLVLSCALLTSVMSQALEVFGSFVLPRGRTRPAADSDGEGLTVVIAAHLPNERNVIIGAVESALNLRCGDAPVRVICAFNGVGEIPALEAALDRMQNHNQRLLVLPVHLSATKADNLNVAILHAQTPFVLFLDADARTNSASVAHALTAIHRGADVVQGRNRVVSAGRFGQIIGAEYDAKHLIAYDLRSRVLGVAYFCGSNGYWTTRLVQEVAFDPTAYVEDIDASLRATLGGARVVYCPEAVADELAPATLTALWRQRWRWAYGWAQLLKYAPRIANSSLTWPQRTWWLHSLFGNGLVQPGAAAWLLLFASARGRPGMTLRKFGAIAAFAGLLTAPATGIAVARHEGWRRGLAVLVGYVPLEFVRTVASIAALVCRPRWVPTPRGVVPNVAQQLGTSGARTEDGPPKGRQSGS